MVVGEILAALALVKGIGTILKDLKDLVRSCTCEEEPPKRKEGKGNHAVQQEPPKRKEGKGNHGKSQRSQSQREKEESQRQREKEKEQRQREKEREQRQREKDREESEYRDCLKKNVTKLTDSWTRYKERATNSKLDPAKKERLFRKHMEGLREKYQQYRQLLKEVIKPESKNKYLTSWSAAERLLQGHQRFDRFPEREREREWSSHVKQISKKRPKTK